MALLTAKQTRLATYALLLVAAVAAVAMLGRHHRRRRRRENYGRSKYTSLDVKLTGPCVKYDAKDPYWNTDPHWVWYDYADKRCHGGYPCFKKGGVMIATYDKEGRRQYGCHMPTKAGGALTRGTLACKEKHGMRAVYDTKWGCVFNSHETKPFMH